MNRFRMGWMLFALAVVLFTTLGSSPALAQKAAKKAAPAAEDPTMLALEVAALQTLQHLDLSSAQLHELLRMGKATASTAKPQGPMRVTPNFVKTLRALRNALLADDEDRIDELKSKLDDIMTKERIQVPDRTAITEAARQHAAQVVRLLKPGQVLSYLEVLSPEDVEPLEILLDALERGKKVNAAEWKRLREQAAADAAWLVAGNDRSKSAPVAQRLADLLDQPHAGGSQQELERQLKQMTASLDSFEILRRAMEREMAELLSNPCLLQAVQHTLEQRGRLAAKK
jgi:hypothetical protein